MEHFLSLWFMQRIQKWKKFSSIRRKLWKGRSERAGKIHLRALAERRIMRRHNSSFTPFYRCPALFRGTRRHRTHVEAPQQHGLATLWYKHTRSRIHISTFSKKSCRNSKVGLYKSLIIVMCEYLRTFNRFIFTTFPWNGITQCFPVSFITAIYCCKIVRDVSTSSENRNALSVQETAWTLELFKRGPWEQTDALEKNKQNKNQNTTLHSSPCSGIPHTT